MIIYEQQIGYDNININMSIDTSWWYKWKFEIFGGYIDCVMTH